MDHIPFSLSLTILLLLQCTTTTVSQTLAPSPAGPANITKILEKAGQFTTLLRLFQITQVGNQINTQLNNSNNGLTVFAPTDNAFSALPGGTLNSLSDQQKVALVQFHILPNFLSMSQFQTVSNPLRTQAGDSANGAFPLNITTSGNQVNVSTGVDDATVANTIYSDNQLAVYQVDKVLLPFSLFGTPAPAAAPVSPKADKKKTAAADSPLAGGDNTAATDSSDAVGGATLHGVVGIIGLGILATFNIL